MRDLVSAPVSQTWKILFQGDLQRLLHGRVEAGDPPGHLRLEPAQQQDEAARTARAQIGSLEGKAQGLQPDSQRLSQGCTDCPEETGQMTSLFCPV